ncbi:MAG: hypothetical protein IPM64_04160 [Phycisphaerales bacterium]|nr:hypothetical protein [Phycisphaerales bacterium]
MAMTHLMAAARAAVVTMMYCAAPLAALAEDACCTPDGGCQAISEAQCNSAGGVFLAGQSCAAGACGVGACCAGPSCVQATAYVCVFNGRDFLGAGLNCADNPCQFEQGTCCVGGICEPLLPPACAAAGGQFLGFGNTCVNEPCTPGACCVGVTCSETNAIGCMQAGGSFLPGGGCMPNPCVPDFACSATALFGQNRDTVDSFEAGTSEEQTQFRRFDNFSGVAGPIEQVRFWGFDLGFAGGFFECVESDPTFQITFHRDAGGRPGAVVCSHSVLATRTPTGVFYDFAELNEYVAVLPEPCVLTGGWIGITGQGDPSCWFLWISAGPGSSWCDGCAESAQSRNRAFCLEGPTGGVSGACCNPATGACADGVDIANCASAALRFHPGATCGQLDPPCGVIVGACCREDLLCFQVTAAECDELGGVWSGADTSCDHCPCVVFCPSTATNEGEPLCSSGYVDEYNGGCGSAAQASLPLSFNVTVCGTSGIFEGGGGGMADQDWYSVTVGGPTLLRWTVRAEFAAILRIVSNGGGCESAVEIASLTTPTCETTTLQADVGAGDYWLVVQPLVTPGDNAACGARYHATAQINSVRGDMNCDGVFNNFDIDPFVLAVVDPVGYAIAYPGCDPLHGDLDDSGALNNFDIDPFVTCLVSGCP